MGEIADLIIEGEVCQFCMCELGGDAPGYPRTCRECREPTSPKLKPVVKVACPICHKRVKLTGLKDHTKVVHP